MTKKKVLHIIPAYGGGISSFVKSLAIGSDGTNLINYVAAFSNFPSDYRKIIEKRGGKCFILQNAYRNPFSFVYTLCKILSQEKYYALHCHISGFKGFVFKLFAYFTGIKNIYTHAHRSSDEYKGALYKIQRINTLLFSNLLNKKRFSCSKLASDFIFGKKVQSIFLPNSIDLKKWTVVKQDEISKLYRKELFIKEESLVLGHIGRFNNQKNHEFILEMVQGLKERQRDVTCVFCGNGILEKQIKQKARDLNIEDSIRFLGFRNDTNLLSSCFDIFILPSLYEGLPTVAVEMQACGIPCILSDTITREVDMGLDLLTYLPLDVNAWINHILNNNFIHRKDNQNIQNKIFQKGYSTIGLCHTYIKNIL